MPGISGQLSGNTFCSATAAARPAMPAPTTKMVSFVFPNSAVPVAAMHSSHLMSCSKITGKFGRNVQIPLEALAAIMSIFRLGVSAYLVLLSTCPVEVGGAQLLQHSWSADELCVGQRKLSAFLKQVRKGGSICFAQQGGIECQF